MMAAVAEGDSTRSVLAIRLLPRTRARAFGVPMRTEKPAARSTMRGAGGPLRGAGDPPRGAADRLRGAALRGAPSPLGFVDIILV